MPSRATFASPTEAQRRDGRWLRGDSGSTVLRRECQNLRQLAIEACCWFATDWANCDSWPPPNSLGSTAEGLPFPSAEVGNADAMCCDNSATCWFNAESPLWPVGIGGSTRDVPPWPSLDTVKFASE